MNNYNNYDDNDVVNKISEFGYKMNDKIDSTMEPVRKVSSVAANIFFIFLGGCFIVAGVYSLLFPEKADSTVAIIGFLFGGVAVTVGLSGFVKKNKGFKTSKLQQTGIYCKMKVQSIDINNTRVNNIPGHILTLVNVDNVPGCLGVYQTKPVYRDVYQYINAGDMVVVYVDPTNPEKFFVDYSQVSASEFDVSSEEVWAEDAWSE